MTLHYICTTKAFYNADKKPSNGLKYSPMNFHLNHQRSPNARGVWLRRRGGREASHQHIAQTRAWQCLG